MERAGRRGRWVARRTLAAAGLAIALLAGAAGDPTRAQQPVDLDGPFVDVPAVALDRARQAAGEPPNAAPRRSRPLQLDRAAMGRALSPALEGGGGRSVLALPAPDGTTARFEVWENDVMAPALRAKLPEIRTFSGQGIDDPSATIALDLSPLGFHAMVLSPDGTWYIDPAVHLEDRFHESFYRDDLGPAPEFVEQLDDELGVTLAEAPLGPPAARSSGTHLRTHRLAVAATSGYTTELGGKAAAEAQIAVTINRVSLIYGTELAIGFQLVGDNDLLVYESAAGPGCTGPSLSIVGTASSGGEVEITTDAAHGLAVDDVVDIQGSPSLDGKWAVRSITSATSFALRGSAGIPPAGGTVREWFPTAGTSCDPFNNSDDDIDVNQAVVDQVIGDADYDVGHVFTSSGGGIAGLGVAGISDRKARGLTGLPFDFQLKSDEFAVDFVAHEIGHQYGGSHTFNGTDGNCAGGNWGGQANAYEPGSGSTIQAYAGICGLDNLQNGGDGTQDGDGTNASDPYFHSHSYDQIQDHVDAVFGAGTPTGNGVPTVDAGPTIVVPAQTPFFLGAKGSDPDGDPLTYHYEQRNTGVDGDAEPLDEPEVTTSVGPLFRSFPPTTDPTSFLPRLSDLVDGSTNQDAVCPVLTGANRNAADCWAQFLIQTAGAHSIPFAAERELHFRATVRDNRAGGGGVNSDDTIVIVHNTGSRFRVTAPNGGGSIAGATTVTWDVAGTTGASISASTVSIRLSIDGGLTYPTVLAANVANDGSHPVTMPNANHTDARVMVHSGTYGGGSGFFDISDADFTTLAFGPSPPSAPINPQGTPGDEQVTVSWTAPSSDGGSPILAYDVTATPGGATCGPTLALTCTVTGLTNGVSYTFAVTATNAVGTGPAASTSPVTPDRPGFTSVAQRRLEDTRPTGKIGNGTTTGTPFKFDALGRFGVPNSGVDAVSLNITVDRGEQPAIGGGYITVYSHPTCAPGTQPTASNLNFHDAQPIANAVLTPVQPDGTVCIFVYGTADLLVDINGYFPD